MKFLYFSPIMWDDLKQRPQHIAEELARDNNVLFVEPSVSYIKGLKSGYYRKRYLNVNDNLDVIRFSGKFRIPKSLDVFGINKYFERKKILKYLTKEHIIWLGTPISYSYVEFYEENFIIYDKMDDYASLTKNNLLKKTILFYEKKLLNRADMILTSSNFMFSNLIKKYKNVKLIKNGISKEFINPKIIVPDDYKKIIFAIRENGKKIFGYIGTIDYWFDFKILDIILENPSNVVVLVGKFNLKPSYHENLYCFESVEKRMIPGVLGSFDYCLYPFECDFIDTIDPVKIYEYIAMNKIVLAKKSLETENFVNKVFLYNDYKEFSDLIFEINRFTKPFSDCKSKESYINSNLWERKIREILLELNLCI